jgi:hypothetical protein
MPKADYTSRMGLRPFLLACGAICVAAALSRGQGTQVKANAGQYFAHAVLDRGYSLGADFLGKYLPVPGATVYSDEYIFVEVALFGAPGKKIDVHTSQFVLKINGREFKSQPPGMVTLDDNFPEMVARPEIVIDGGAGNGEVQVGGPQARQRFPGDDPAHTPHGIPQASTDPSQGQVSKSGKTPDEIVKASELPEGSHALPLAGYLFFVYEGKLKKIKHAELEYVGPLGRASLALR